MNYRTLKPYETEGIIWGLIVTIMLAGGGVPPAFALVVGIIFVVVAVFVLDFRR
jgi:ammonia channel protein AmtB